MSVIVLATANRHKAAEIAAMLPPAITLRTHAETGFSEEIQETAETIKGNSLIKAQTVKTFLEKKGDTSWVIADDSGLEVKALGGAPGVLSARYAGLQASDADNVKKLLSELHHKTDRKARFVTVITLIGAGGTHFFEGTISGTIAIEARGKNGFGYDPVFIPTGCRSTFAELPAEEKNRISHRAAAVKKLMAFIGSL